MNLFSVLNKGGRGAADLVLSFARAREAVAAVEFALILPILILLYVGSVEVSLAITTNNRVTTVASSVGDLVARAQQKITTGELDDYFAAAANIMTPYSSTNLKQVVTSVAVSNSGTATVEWSQGYNGGIAHNAGAPYALPQELIDIAKGKYVIVTEAQLMYTPLFDAVFKSSFPLYHEDFHLPRFGQDIQLTP